MVSVRPRGRSGSCGDPGLHRADRALKALGLSHVLIRFMVQTQEHILRAIQIIGEQVIPQVS
jgi:hypothetical protein